MDIYQFNQFPWYAMVIFYQDGTIDAVLINHLRYHIEYFQELMQVSKKILVVKDAIDLGYTGILVALKRLALENAYVFFNFNIRDIQQDFSFVYQNLPGFKVYGKHCGSEVQWNYLNEFVNGYDLEQVGVQLLGEDQEFHNIGSSWINPIGFQNHMKEEKQRLLRKKEFLNEKY